jgi:hypothetical protein
MLPPFAYSECIVWCQRFECQSIVSNLLNGHLLITHYYLLIVHCVAYNAQALL